MSRVAKRMVAFWPTIVLLGAWLAYLSLEVSDLQAVDSGSSVGPADAVLPSDLSSDLPKFEFERVAFVELNDEELSELKKARVSHDKTEPSKGMTLRAANKDESAIRKLTTLKPRDVGPSDGSLVVSPITSPASGDVATVPKVQPLKLGDFDRPERSTARAALIKDPRMREGKTLN